MIAVAVWPRRVLMAVVRIYQLLLSPWLGSSCRFEPTCSHYALGALQQHGALAGSVLAAGRIARCAPWCAGGHDPVPATLTPLFSALLGRRAKPPPSTETAGTASSAPASP